MRPRPRAALPAPGLLAALLLLPALAAQPAQAQVPETGQAASDLLTQVSVNVDPPSQDVPRLGQAYYKVTVQDLSADKQSAPQGVAHQVFLSLDTNATASPGWVAFLGASFFQTKAGDTVQSQLVVQAPPTIKTPYFRATIRVQLVSLLLGTASDDTQVVARVLPFSLASIDLRAAPPEVGPDETTTFPVTITNDGLYPDQFNIEASGPEGWFVEAEPRATLFPGETKDVQVHVITPATRVLVPRQTGIISVRVSSVNDPGTVYERAAVITLQGTYLPGYWGPLLALGAVAGASLAARGVEGARRRNRELGKPEPARLTPAQAVALRALKKQDPARYRAITRGQRRLFLARQRAFGSVRARRMRLESALLSRERVQGRQEDYERKVRERLARQRQQEVERARARAERARREEERRRAAEQRRAELAAERERQRQQRLAAPDQRREQRERRVRQRKLQAELRRKQRLLAAEQRRKRAEVERKRRLVERKQREAERRARRRAQPGQPGRKPRKGRGAA